MIEYKRDKVSYSIILDGKDIGTFTICPDRKSIDSIRIRNEFMEYYAEVANYLIENGYNVIFMNTKRKEEIRILEECGFVRSRECGYTIMDNVIGCWSIVDKSQWCHDCYWLHNGICTCVGEKPCEMAFNKIVGKSQ